MTMMCTACHCQKRKEKKKQEKKAGRNNINIKKYTSLNIVFEFTNIKLSKTFGTIQ